MEKSLRVAVIGAGRMANRVHYPSLASFDDVELAAICDLDEVRLKGTGEKYDVERRYTNYQTMVEAVAPDAVYAIGQPHLMYDVWVWCLERGLNLFVEKPLGLTLHQARALAYLAEKNGCITQVGFQRRTCPLLVQLRAACLKRGPIVHAMCRFYKCAPEPFLGARDHMLDDGVHAIDTLRWLCGGEVVDVNSVTQRRGVPDVNFITALLTFDNEATGLLVNSWTSGRRVFSVEMHAPGICAEADPEGRGALYADGNTQGMVYDTQKAAASDELFVYAGFQAKSREFIDGVRSGTLPPSHFGDAAKTMEVAARILAQAVLRGD